MKEQGKRSGLGNSRIYVWIFIGLILLAGLSGGTQILEARAAPGDLIASGLSGPFGMVFDATGNLYIANEGAGGGGLNVSKLPPGGPLELAFSTDYVGPSGVAFNSHGELFVSDDTNNIYQVDTGGDRTVFIDSDLLSPPLANPNAIAFDSADNLYVVSAGGYVSVFGPSGAELDTVLAGGFSTPQAIVIDDAAGLLYISDINGQIHQIDKTTGDSSLYVDTGRGGTQGGLVMDAAGDLFLAAYEHGEIVRVDAGDLSVWVCQRDINEPRGLVFDAAGNLLITSYADGEIYLVEGCNAPVFLAWPAAEAVEALGWPESTIVDLTIVDGLAQNPDYHDSAVVDYVGSGPWATFLRFELPEGIDLKAGDQVLVSGSGLTKTHIVTELTIDGAEAPGDTVWGTAVASSDIDLSIHDQPGTEMMVSADGAGGWLGDFSAIWDLQIGDGVVATQTDMDGDWTHAEFFIQEAPLPSFQAKVEEDRITGFEWPEGVLVYLTIDDPNTGPGTDWADQQVAYYPEWSPDTTWVEFDFGSDFDLKAGDIVELSDGVTVKTHLVTSLAITGLDLDLDQISGTAESGSFVNVFPHDDCCWGLSVEAIGADWTADLATVVYDDGRIGYDLQPGSDGGAEQADEDGDSTWIQWTVPNPTLHVVPAHPEAHGHEWGENAWMTLIVDDDDDQTNGILWEGSKDLWDDPWCGEPCFDLTETVPIVPGTVVHLSDGTVAKTVHVTALTWTGADPAADLVYGQAEPGTDVRIDIFQDGAPSRQVTADVNGYWEADFSIAGDEDWEQDTWDLSPGSQGRAIQHENDYSDDGTLAYWNISNPTFGVRPTDERVEGWEWPPDAQVTLEIDWDNDPNTGPLFSGTQMVEQAEWDPNQTWLEFDLWEVIDIQAGMYVTLSDGNVTKDHWVTDLAIVEVDVDGDLVHGVSEPGSQMNIWICDEFGCADRGETAGPVVPPQTLGAWTADFSVPGEEEWEQATWDIQPGTWIDSAQWDEDGDGTFSGWHIDEPAPPPYFSVVVNHQEVHGQYWPEGDILELTIDLDPQAGNGAEFGPFYAEAAPAPWNPEQTFASFELSDVHPDPAQLVQPGTLVIVSNGEITKIHIIEPLFVDQVNPLNQTIAGSANPYIIVGVGNGNLGEYLEIEPALDGSWSASSPSWMLEPFRGGHAEQIDEDGDSTQFQIRLPTVDMYYWGSNVMVGDFSHNSDVQVAIYHGNPAFGNPIVENLRTTDETEPPQFNFQEAYEFEIQPGDQVVVTDLFSGLVKDLVMVPLNITSVDLNNDIITGSGPPPPSPDDPPWLGLHLRWDDEQYRGENINDFLASDGSWSVNTAEAFGADLVCEMELSVAWVDQDYDAAIMQFAPEAWFDYGSFGPNPVAVEQFIDGNAAFTANIPIENLQVLIAGSPETDWVDLAADDGSYGGFQEAGVFENLQVPSVAGVYPVIASAQTECGEWFGELGFLAVYDPNGGFVTGGGQIVPGGSSSYDDDWLPGLNSTSPAAFGFSVKYKKGATVPSGHIMFQYMVGDFKLQSSDFDFLMVTNSVWARFWGTATIDGVEGLFPFRVDARDSDKLGGNQDDRFIIRIWAPDADIDQDDPIYKASGDVQGQIRIHDKKDPVLILGGLFEFATGVDFTFGAADAVQQAVNDANEAGGALGADVVLYMRDANEPGSEQVRAPAQELIEMGAQALVGPLWSTNTAAILEDIVVPSGVPLISPSNTETSLAEVSDDGLYFRMSDSEALRGVMAAQRACDRVAFGDLPTAPTAALIMESTQGDLAAIAQAFSDEFAMCGGVALEPVVLDAAGGPAATLHAVFDTQAPEMVFYLGFDGGQAVEVVREAFCVEDSDLVPAYDRYWLFAHESLLWQDFPNEVTAWNSCGAPAEASDLAGYEDLAPAFYYDYGGMDTVYSNLAYDAAALLILAAEEAGSIDGDEIAEHLHSVSSGGTPVYDLATALEMVRDGEDIDWQGTFQRPAELGYGDYNHDFEADGLTISPYVFRRIQENGSLVFVTEPVSPGQLAFYVPSWPGMPATYEETAFAAFGLAAWIEAATGLEVRAVVPNGDYAFSQEAAVDALNSGAQVFAMMDWLPYLMAHEASGAQAFLSMQLFDQPFYEGQILTYEGSNINSIADLDGRSLCWPDPTSASGYIIPSLMLIAEGLDPDLNAWFAGGHFGVVENIYHQECEAGAAFVDARTFLADPFEDIFERVLQIGKTPPIPNTGFAAAAGLDPALLASLSQALQDAAATDQGAEWLGTLFSADLVPTDPSAYDGIAALITAAGETPESVWDRYYR
jgi:phosphonate transport system substrate-binding protein